ncbi:MAG: hypothetical protein ACRDBY_00735 [Cetobacterium sp.]
MILRCRYCNEVMKKVYEEISTSSETPYVCTYECPNCEVKREFDESCGLVEMWNKKNGEIEVVDL